MVRSASEVEQNIVSVERILHQTNLEPEAPQEIPDEKPSDVWPTEGAIEFRLVLEFPSRKLSIDTVLQTLFCTLSPRSRLGVEGC